MKVAHVAPFAPNRCGLYEAARDMARADVLGGHGVYFIDAGITKNGKREKPQIGAVDDRAGFKLVTTGFQVLDDADIIIMHTGINDSYLVRNQTPLIWVVHGRPHACFKPERQGKGNPYSLYRTVSNWQRTKGMLYFWREFQPDWEDIFNGKDIILPYPVIDETRFKNNSTKRKLNNPGKINILVCDSEREDIDLYNLTVGLIEVAKKYPDIKIHYYGLEMPGGKLPNCWNILLGKLKKYGGLGDVAGRVADMEQLYNAVDLVVSPNRIVTRTIGEALTCGTPVLSQNNPLNLVSDYTCDMSDPKDMIEAFEMFLTDRNNNTINRDNINKRAKVFNLKVYSDYMNEVYKKVISG